MKKGVYFVVFLLLISSALALFENKIFSGTILNEELFEADGKNFSMIFIRGANNTVIYYPENITDVLYSNETCTEEWIYKTCLKGVKFMKNGRELPSNVHEGAIEIHLDIDLFSSDVGMFVSRGFPKTNLFSGEDLTVSVNLTNDGAVNTTDIKYIEEIPPGILILSTKSCEREFNEIVWTGTLKPGKSHECLYTIRVIPSGDFYLNSTLEYSTLGTQVKKTYTKKISVEGTPFSTEHTTGIVAAPEMPVGLSLNLSSEEDVGIDLSIDIPQEILLINQSSIFAKHKNTLTWSGDLMSDRPMSFNYTISSKILDEYDINYTISYTFNLQKREWTDTAHLSVHSGMFYVKLRNNKNSTLLRLVNPTEYYFREIYMFVNSTGYSNTIVYKEIPAKHTEEFRLPLIEDPDVKIKYKTQYGQEQTYVREGTYTRLNENGEPILVKNETDSKSATRERAGAETQEKKDDTSIFKDIEKTKLSFDFETFKIPLMIALVVFVAVLALFFIITKSRHTDLDDEIKEIKEE